MKRTICSIAALLAASPYTYSDAYSEKEPDSAAMPFAKKGKIEEVITIGSPIHNDEDKIIRGISVLSGDKLKEKSAATIGETLKGELGISASSFGPGVGIPVIRGQSATRVKVMQDSLDTLDASASSPDHAAGSEPLLAERIEVLRGPSTLRYGNGAIGGVVNIVDNRIPARMPERLEGGMELRNSGVNNGNNAVFKLDGGSGQFAWHLDGLYRSTNNLNIKGPALHAHEEDVHDGEEEETTIGFVDNTNSRTQSATAGFSWVGDEGFVGLSVSRLANNYGIPPGAHEHHEDGDNAVDGLDEHDEETVRIDLKQTRYDLKGEFENPMAGFQKISFRVGHNDYEHVELEGGETGTRFTNDAWESRVELVHNPLNDWQGALGLQMLQRDFAAIGDEAFIPESNIRNYGAFVVEDWDKGDWHVELGLRTERQDIEPVNQSSVSHNTFTSSGSVQWLFAEDQHLSFSLTRAERAPSVEELFSNGAHLATNQFIVGDSGLDTENSTNYELGYHYHSDTSFKLFVFYNDIGDFIFAQNSGIEFDELPLFEYRQQDATFQGVETELSVPLNDRFNLTVFGDCVRAEFVNGGDVPRITPVRYGSQLEYRDNELSANLRWTRVQDQNHPGEAEEATEGYDRVDATISYLVSRADTSYTLFLHGGNLLNQEIRNATSFLREAAPEAGRNIELGVRLTF